MSVLSGSLRGLTALHEHNALRTSCELCDLILESRHALVISGMCDRSSMRWWWWWWRFYKPAVPPEAHTNTIHLRTHISEECSQGMCLKAGISRVPGWHGNSSLNETNHCHGPVLIKTMSLSVADGTSHQTASTHFHSVAIIPPISHDWWL